MGKMPINWLGKSSELKLHCFCLFDAYRMPKDMCSVGSIPTETWLMNIWNNGLLSPICSYAFIMQCKQLVDLCTTEWCNNGI